MTVDAPLLYSYADTGRLLGVSVRTVRRMIAAGQLRMVTVGGSKRVPRSELMRLIDTPNQAIQEAR